MVGQVTSVLAEENYNIEHMMNRSRGAWAYTMIDVLDEPSSAVIGKIEAIDGIIKVRVIEQAS